MRLIDADRSDEIIIFDKQNELLQCSVVREYCERQREFLNKFPTIDAQPVQHGHFIMKKTALGVPYTVCSHCNTSVKYKDEHGIVVMNLNGANYCPNCGAKIDEVIE